MELGLRLGAASPPFHAQNPRRPTVPRPSLAFSLAFSDEPHSGGDGDDSPVQLDLLSRPSSEPGVSENGGLMECGGESPGSAAELWKYGGGGMEVDDGGDEEDQNVGSGSRKKLRLSREQSAFLEESFKEHHTLYPKQKLELARRLNLRPRQVEVWFQNRRARTKLKQTEVDCEYLKKCCETLTEENRKLQKELQDLRALKTTDSLYMHSPATTLTICPSCERVATSAASAAVQSGRDQARTSGFSFIRPSNSCPFPYTQL